MKNLSTLEKENNVTLFYGVLQPTKRALSAVNPPSSQLVILRTSQGKHFLSA
jgi:hypothetical protein